MQGGVFSFSLFLFGAICFVQQVQFFMPEKTALF
jgi:hypothetical protein